MNFQHSIEWLFGSKDPIISREEAISIARNECKKRNWAWQLPVKVQLRFGVWVIQSNWGRRGMNARIVIDQKTGEVIKAIYLPR